MPSAPALAHPGQLDLGLEIDQREQDIQAIHSATGFYTSLPEVRGLLDGIGWPGTGRRLLDPAAGNAGIVVAALSRVSVARDAAASAASLVKGYEFHPGAVAEARRAVRGHLTSRGWSPAAARDAALRIIEQRDFLLGPAPEHGGFGTIVTNPPYLRLANLPAGYRADYETTVPGYAKADMLYAYLDKCAGIAARDALIGQVTADRWLINAGAAKLRRRIGERFRVTAVRRLDTSSAFYSAKTRVKGTPPRIHPVSIILTPGTRGRGLDASPFRIEELPVVVGGVPLPSVAEIRLAPWLGPDGVFLTGSPGGLPGDCLVPVVEPRDIDGDTIRPPRKWALVTRPDVVPPPEVMAHLKANLHRMPPRGRRETFWLPPETFAGRLPLDHDAVLVPRIATHLKAVRLPAGRLPVNHQLVIVSGLPAGTIIRMLQDKTVQAQADSLAAPVENGFRSYTTTLLRELVIPGSYLREE
jgi:hypothetical protein